MFIIRRFIKDFSAWEIEYAKRYTSSMTSTNDLVSFLTGNTMTIDLNEKNIRKELESWMDVTVEEMVASFRKQKMETKHLLLFLKENHERYFDRSHLVKCSNKHVIGTFPLDDGIDGGASFCPYCEQDVQMPEKIHQQVVYNWKE